VWSATGLVNVCLDMQEVDVVCTCWQHQLCAEQLWQFSSMSPWGKIEKSGNPKNEAKVL